MKVLVTFPGQFAQTPDGRGWSLLPPYAYEFWTRYLRVFAEVRIIARTMRVDEPPPHAVLATGEHVSLAPVPFYQGPTQYARQVFHLRRAVRKVLQEPGAVILRLPCPLGSLVWQQLRSRPYGVEVIGDPFDNLAPGVVKHPARPVLRWLLTHRLRRECAQASTSAYVSQTALQERYPPASGTFTTHYSSIDLAEEDFSATSSQFSQAPEKPVLVSVGQFSNLNKGQDTLVRAAAQLREQGKVFRLRFIGDGKYRAQVETLVQELGVEHDVEFLGYRNKAEILAELDQADLFVLPSRQEGVPRAVIEAMARGLPCVASTVGGTGELLPADELVPPNQPKALAQLLFSVLGDAPRLTAMAERNRQRAWDYRSSALQVRRLEHYRALLAVTSKGDRELSA